MLTIAKLSAGGEAYYLSTVATGVEDYYVGTGEVAGYWAGTAAAELGATGDVTAESLRALLGGTDAAGGRLAGMRGNRKVPGWDATVAAPKSVSLLWALAEPDAAEAVREAHDAAVAAALAYLEGHAAFTRRGTNGVEHVQVDGLAAAAFRHRSSRNLDPHLHTHVLIANTARTGDDGRWRTIESRYLYAGAKTAGYLYQAVLRHELTARLGVAWGPVVNGHADLAGIPRALIEVFSTRTAELRDHLAVERGEAGDGEVRHDWTAREAELAAYKTRQAKQRFTDGQPLRQRWRAIAEAHGWTPDDFTRLLGQTTVQSLSPTRLGAIAAELAGPSGLTATDATFDLGDVVRAWAQRLPAGAPGEEILALARKTVADTHVAVRLLHPDGADPDRRDDLAAVNAVLTRLAPAAGPEVLASASLVDAVTQLLAAGVDADGLTARLTARELDSAHDPVAVLVWRAQTLAAEAGVPARQPGVAGDRPDWHITARPGGAVTVTAARPRYSTPELLATEQQALDDATQRRGARCGIADDRSVAVALGEHAFLAAEQAALVRRVTTDRGGVHVVIGPAGTGKTAALAAAARAYTLAGIDVRGCALSGRAALQLAQDTNIAATTIAALLRDLDPDDPIDGPFPRLPAGSVLIVDEAGMVDTRTLAKLLLRARRDDVRLVLVGDPAQLPELGAGGLYAALLRQLDPIVLATNRRQVHDWDRHVLARLRDGDPAPLLTAYHHHDRLTVADTDTTARDRMAIDWAAWAATQPDRSLGQAVMLAARRDHTDALNRTARTLLRAQGRLGADQLTAGGRVYAVGDRIVCLRNDRRLDVVNGTRGAITAIDPAGGGAVTVTVDGAEPRQVVLPGWYLRDGHLGHGYALTVHKAQGATVDRAWVYADPRTVGTQWLYTALTRHRDTAHLYTSITTLDELGVAAETHGPAPDPNTRTADHALRALAAKGARSQAKTLATDHSTPATATGLVDHQPEVAPRPATPAAPAAPAPRPPAREWPAPIGLDL